MLHRFLALLRRHPREVAIDQQLDRLQRVHAEFEFVLAGLQNGDIGLEDLGE
ncbi:hypothetical protein POL68_09820 [Stigmatella sp. ncwal1]|uniref:Uncharacterized protein n=1 Tax=Stigmatella ashevillensis TaxID=2995309 RepID=A0ABT5D524_9BACT|nr:hypothetical protein [Stigmatella ashevillena]MDC0708764.1 hypothetical protein [Stigmatella ashevillena]